MQFRVRHPDPSGKFISQLRLELLVQVFPRRAVAAVLAECGAWTLRQRKLNLEVTLWLVIGMSLFAQMPIEEVLQKLAHGLRLVWPQEDRRRTLLASKPAISYRRYQLGVRPVRRLFHRLCQPMATPETRGAFLFGLRLMALDGHTQDVPDTRENAAAFGRSKTDRGESAYPQVRCVSLCECGTHSIVDTTFWPARTGERRGAWRLLRSLSEGMLLLWDRGFHDYELVAAVRSRGVHLVGRLPDYVKPQHVRWLPDGSRLVKLLPNAARRRRLGEHLLVRLIEYTLDDPQLPGYGTRYRLITTLVDPEAFPAHALACAYHERWEIELVIDEQDTHQLGQHQPASPLRSRKPRGVIQELYGLMLAHYAVRFLMHQAALAADEDPERLSFVGALRIVQDSVSDFEMAAPQLIPQLCRRLLQDLADALLPERKLRVEPRVVKRKVIKWPLKRPHHDRWPQPTRPFCRAVRLLHPDEVSLI
jgi:Insertion element 4 transposase N-terminal/Transposase DDE domain